MMKAQPSYIGTIVGRYQMSLKEGKNGKIIFKWLIICPRFAEKG